ncbi:MAG: hypothetical protein Q7S82_04025 [bacterium]|nr:hypothetical protein [bacterium]
MLKKNRTILFFICAFLFFIVAPFFILYSQGYRLDLENKKLSQTGGFFFKVLPKQTEIYLDGKLVKKTDFFFGSALVENILPRKYKVEIKKEGYYSWEKSLAVKEKEVTEIKTAILFPQRPNFNVLTKGVENFWLSPDQKNIIIYEKENNIWELKLYELDKNLKSQLISEKDISLRGAELFNLEFSPDSKEIFLEAAAGEKIRYFSLQTDIIPSTLIETTPPLISNENILAYQKVNNALYYLDNFGHLFKADTSLASKQKINENPFPVQQETDYKLKVFQSSIFLQENKNLYQFNPDSRTFEKFFGETNNIKISPNSKKLVYFSDYEIWILYLQDEGMREKAGSKVFLMRLSEKIQNLNWLNSDYLIFNTGDKIKISEVDERDKVNIIDIAEYKNPEPFWSEDTKKLYILSEGNLYQSDKLIK